MSKNKIILLVCTGNSCRSVMAAGLLRELLKDKSDYEIMTAGVAALGGMRPTRETVQVMSEQNIDISGHLSKPLTDEMIDAADLILVMEGVHKEHILSRRPKAKEKVYLLSEFARIEREDKLVNPDIPDPIGKSIEFYRKVLNIITESIERTVKELEEQ